MPTRAGSWGGGSLRICAPDGARRDRDGPLVARHPADRAAVPGRNYAPFNNPVLHRPVEPERFTSLRYGERRAEIGAVPSIGTVGDSFDNALAETVNGYYKADLIRGPARHGTWRTVEDVELATLCWVPWYNHQRLHGSTATSAMSRQQSSRRGPTLPSRATRPRLKSKDQSLHQTQCGSIAGPSRILDTLTQDATGDRRKL